MWDRPVAPCWAGKGSGKPQGAASSPPAQQDAGGSLVVPTPHSGSVHAPHCIDLVLSATTSDPEMKEKRSGVGWKGERDPETKTDSS